MYLIGKLIVSTVSILLLSACGSGGSSNNSESRIDGFYYSFDESGPTIVDYSGNNFDGEASSISRVEGKVGGAVKFLTEGSTIELEGIYDYYPFDTGLTFRAWVKIENAVTTRQQIIGGSTGGESAAIVDGFGLSLIDDRISFELPAEQNALSSQTAPLSFPIDTWFHIAVTYNGDTLSFYYNGNLVATDSILTTFEPVFYNHIGNNQRIFGGVNIEDQFLETIDELYLENEIMTAQEIMDYYLGTL
jgi:hypothetical protein